MHLMDMLRHRSQRWSRGVLAASIAGVTTIGGFAMTTQGAHAATPPHGPAGEYGFDTCAAPSMDTMKAWAQYSPYQAAGVYVGGANRACGDGNLNATWVARAQDQGWGLIPIYVGLQAPCSNVSGVAKIDPTNATVEGLQSADDAIGNLNRVGLGPGHPIFFDMEGYPRGGDCSLTVATFLKAWNAELRARGYMSGVYSSLNSGIADMVQYPEARSDEVWIAYWNSVGSTQDSGIPADLWANHQRIKQYRGGQETYGNVTQSIDTNVLDATLAK